MKVEQEHVERPLLTQNEVSAVKSLDTSVFDNFKKLTSSEEEVRIKASLYLLQHFTKIRNEQENSGKEFQYAIKRLIRGLGASTTASRSGFFITIVGFLKLFLCDRIDVEAVLKICKKQLSIGKTVSNKEDSDAVVGQILTCGALIRSTNFSDMSSEDLKKIIEVLISCSRHRIYHCSLAFSFIVECIQKINENQFVESVRPLIDAELRKPWDKQTINTIHCLIVASKKFPNILTVKYFEKNFSGSQLLNSHSSQYLFKLFWENHTTNIVTHPAFEIFGHYIANCKYLEEFWLQTVNEKLAKPNKLIEIETLKILTDILLNIDNDMKVSNLLTQNLIKMIIRSLKNSKLKKDETLTAFYDEFFEALINYCSRINDNDDIEKVEIIRKLILYPGVLNIEKYTGKRIIHRILSYVKENGIKELFEIYKNIFLNRALKNPNDKNDVWLNFERQSAGYMLQTLINHKSIQNSLEWKTQQLKFLMNIALFHTNKDGEILNKINEESSTSLEIINTELTSQIKNIFYTSLQIKLPKLKKKKKILLELVETCNEVLQRKDFNKYLKVRISEDVFRTWNDMYSEVHKSYLKNKDHKLEIVFRILLLHMGLQLFKDPEMAKSSILDLRKCLEKSKKKLNKIPSQKVEESQEEPEWIEVVVDLFLHLLSQNNHALRIEVSSVFPHLCDKLTLNSIHQILSVLDMKGGNNPLSDENSHESENEEETNDEKTLIKINNKNDGESSSDNEQSESEEEDDDNDELMEMEEEEDSTVTDRLRNAVSTALGSVSKTDDNESIDLDNVDEEEGKRLDEALVNAFRAIKKPEDTNRRSKIYRVKTTTLMHFRIRVLDLIEIYIQHEPKMLFTIEILLELYNMIEFCTEKELKPLAVKLDKILTKITSIRQFSNISQDDENDINSKNICDYLRMVIEKKVKAPIFEMHNKFKAKCCIFFIYCGKILCEKNLLREKEYVDEILNLLKEYLNDFIKSRNPVVTITLLNDIFKIRWYGIWQMTEILIRDGLRNTTRVFRRIQILELLDQLFNNHEFIRQDLKTAKKKLKVIESYLQNYTLLLSQSSEISIREFSTILDVFYSMNKCHNKISLNSYIDKNIVCSAVQSIRQQLKLENAHSYTRFCSVFGLKALKNSEILNAESVKFQTSSDTSAGEHNEKNDKKKQKQKKHLENMEIHYNGVTQKRKRSNSDSCKGKKLKKD